MGPPPPRVLSAATRALQLAVLAAMLAWVLGPLGGLSLSPRPVPGGAAGANDTSQLFNWHPLLLTLAFPVLMAEAVLAYQAPLLALKDRPAAKLYHFALHTAAIACVALGVAAAFRSHTAKRPTPVPNLYSVHSWLGLAVLALLAAQYCVGAFAYLTPQLSPAGKRALGPVHRFLGLATFTAGLATMAAGLQEKATFVQAFGMPSSLRAPVLVLPALIAVLLLLTGLAVLAHHAPLPPPPPHHRQASEEEALVTPGGPVTVDSEIEIEDRHSA
ncbi:cytochrome b561 [Micractinium conductrix]|uniref:Cytochrome b561 n=1 Tax=Micractinium conductrix TaxID=554055 RepID=A0A2P6VDJ0_9CHLO|nr:cytochrome b561 [Micractinium conductrix]|eukprot:PSC72170.1 cytochrome b561 [Micractinium conductrix]